MLQPMDGAAVAILHPVEALALVVIEMAAIAPAHPRLGAVQAHLAMLEAPRLVPGQRAVALALADTLFLTMLALVDRLGDGRHRDRDGRGGGKSKDKSLHLVSPLHTSRVARRLSVATTRFFALALEKRLNDVVSRG
jgi:hypothetical protein